MAFQKSDLVRIKRFAQSIMEFIDMHQDTDSDHESADTIECIESEVYKINEEIEELSMMVDWDTTL